MHGFKWALVVVRSIDAGDRYHFLDLGFVRTIPGIPKNEVVDGKKTLYNCEASEASDMFEHQPRMNYRLA